MSIQIYKFCYLLYIDILRDFIVFAYFSFLNVLQLNI